MDEKKRPRRSSGRGILDVHPTQLRRGEGADIRPEQLHIIDVNPEQRIAATQKKSEAQSVASKVQSGSNIAKVRSGASVNTPKAVPPKAITHMPAQKAENRENPANVKPVFIKNTGNCERIENTVNPPKKEGIPTSTPLKESVAEATTKKNEQIIKNNTEASEKEAKARKTVNVILCSVFAAIVVCGLVMSIARMADKGKPTYSDFEKRPLEQMPEFSVSSLADGSYTQGIDRFFSDNFPLREELVKNATFIKRFRGVRAFDKNAKQVIHGDTDIYSDGEMIILIDEGKFTDAPKIDIPGLSSPTEDTDAQTNIPENTESGQSDTAIGDTIDTGSENITDENETPMSEKTETSTETADNPSGINQSDSDANVPQQVPTGDKRDTIYIIGDTAYEYFRGSTKSSGDYINVLNTYAKYIPENVNIYTLVIPTHPEFGLTGIDRTVSNDQKPILEYIGNNLDKRIKFVNPHSKLQKAYAEGEYVYFRTDHHWTIRGAYQAYLEFCEKAQIVPITQDNYEKGTLEPFLGTFYSASGKESALAANPDYVEYFAVDIPCTVTRYDKNDNATKGALYYKKVRGESNGYLAFMGGDFPYVHIKTENTNGKKLMIFKESFGNPLIGLLAQHYEEVHVADIRYFKYNSVNFIKQYGITDVLFCNGIMSANSKARINDLLELMNK